MSSPHALAAPPASPPDVPARGESARVARLFRRHARFGDVAARDELLRRYLPLAQRLARRYHRGHDSLDDLVQVASIGLLKAIDRFDPERGTEFATYAVPTIIGELKRYFRDLGWPVHVPRGDKDRALGVARTVDELSSRLGRSATPAQIAAAAELSVEEVLAALETAAAARPAPFDALGRTKEGDAPSLGDRLACEDEELELVERRDAIARCLRGLPEREHRILFMRFVEDLTQAEIGERVGLSQMQVSRLLRHALEHSQALAAGPVRQADPSQRM
jgi:RNA polymerase sigma-B factor